MTQPTLAGQQWVNKGEFAENASRGSFATPCGIWQGSGLVKKGRWHHYRIQVGCRAAFQGQDPLQIIIRPVSPYTGRGASGRGTQP